MSSAKLGLFVLIGLANLSFYKEWFAAARQGRAVGRPSCGDLLTGLVTDFLDTLGIGSFAPTTAIYRFRGHPSDELIPGTLNAGHNSAALLETIIFVTVIAVDPVLLLSMVLSAAAGAWLGAGIVRRLKRRTIQVIMGLALLIAAAAFVASNLGAFPAGGTAMSLEGWRFGIAVAANFLFGGLMCAGIGLFAPCMITLALLGLHPLGAFPIMTGACALVQPVAATQFLKGNRVAWGPALGLTLGGIVGVLIAAYVVKQLPLAALRWLVAIVVTYAACSMLLLARRSPDASGDSRLLRQQGQ